MFRRPSIFVWMLSLLLASQGVVRSLHHHDVPGRAGESTELGHVGHSCVFCQRHGAAGEASGEDTTDERGGDSQSNSDDCSLCQLLALPIHAATFEMAIAVEAALETPAPPLAPAAQAMPNAAWPRGPPAVRIA